MMSKGFLWIKFIPIISSPLEPVCPLEGGVRGVFMIYISYLKLV